MEQFQHVLLNVWQEACRHIEIGQSTANIAAMLVRHIPIEQVLVRRIDTIRSGLETVAVGLVGNLPHAPTAACPTPGPTARRPSWSRCWPGVAAGGWHAASAGTRRQRDFPLSKVVPGQRHGDALAGPLGDPAGHCGVLVLLAPPGRGFEPAHAELVQLLWSRSPWRWRTICGCGRWPPCARPPRPTNARC